jgi:hypothetical protein
VGVLRARRCHLRAGFQQCKSFVEMCTVRCCPLWHPSHCPMGTVPRVLVRRTASPAHADFGGLSSGAAPVVVRLDVVPLPPRSSAPTVAGCRLGGCRGRYCFGGGVLLFILGSSLGGVGPVRGLRGEEEGGGVRAHTYTQTKRTNTEHTTTRPWLGYPLRCRGY